MAGILIMVGVAIVAVAAAMAAIVVVPIRTVCADFRTPSWTRQLVFAELEVEVSDVVCSFSR